MDIATVLSRILEREGIWNCVVKGSLTLKFPPAAKITPRYFWSIDEGNFTAAHAWVCAPPFYVVDVSVQLQPYAGREARYLPVLVCDEAKSLAEASVEDVVSPDARRFLNLNQLPKERRIHRASPEMAEFISRFPTRQLYHKGTSLMYVPVATGAPDVPFEEIGSIHLDGGAPYEFYKRTVQPKLHPPQ